MLITICLIRMVMFLKQNKKVVQTKLSANAVLQSGFTK